MILFMSNKNRNFYKLNNIGTGMDDPPTDPHANEVRYGTRDSLVRALQRMRSEPATPDSLVTLLEHGEDERGEDEVVSAALERVRTDREGRNSEYDPEIRYRVLCMKYGLGRLGEIDNTPRTRAEMVQQLGLSDERVRQLESDAVVQFKRAYQKERDHHTAPEHT